MDDDTRAALARFERRMANAQALDRRAEGLIEQADALQNRLDHPDGDVPPPDADLTAIEIAALRDRAVALTSRADGIQGRIFEPPSGEIQRQVEDWARRLQDRGRSHDREY